MSVWKFMSLLPNWKLQPKKSGSGYELQQKSLIRIERQLNWKYLGHGTRKSLFMQNLLEPPEHDPSNFTYKMNCKEDNGTSMNQTSNVNSSSCHDDVSIPNEVKSKLKVYVISFHSANIRWNLDWIENKNLLNFSIPLNLKIKLNMLLSPIKRLNLILGEYNYKIGSIQA